MKLYEFAAKKIFSEYGIKVPRGKLVAHPDDAAALARELGSVVIKAQVLTGGRGRAGGILTADDPEEAKQCAQRILGMSIKGFPVKEILVEEYRKPQRELYLGITIDRKMSRPIIMASTEGGVDIEDIARATPEKIMRVHVHPLTGVHEYQARRLARSLDSHNASSIAEIIAKLYRVFSDFDCTLAEINPLAVSADGVLALDAKMVIDDNALFRQDLKEENEDSPEAMARKHGMSYVDLDGDIGCIVNGAGLAMATLDMIKEYGGEPANFMDVRAGANAEQVRTALRIVSSNLRVRAILINIFGGITKCDEVARGIVGVISEITVPVVIRLSGTNEKEGQKILETYGIVWASSTEEAARAVVEREHTRR